jgi:vacuolar-type H+-ATPase subunit E/Vma4
MVNHNRATANIFFILHRYDAHTNIFCLFEFAINVKLEVRFVSKEKQNQSEKVFGISVKHVGHHHVAFVRCGNIRSHAASIERGFCEACTPERAIAMIRRNREIDVKRLKETIEDTLYKLEKAKEADKREEERNAKRQAKQSVIDDIPEVLKAFGEQLIKNTFDDRLRLHKWARKQGWPAYGDFSAKACTIRQYFSFDREATMKEIRRTVEVILLNLVARVQKKCGKILNASNLHLNTGNWLEGQAINGWIEGEKGNAHVYSITAGGYNIQCLHVRVLVK